MLHHSNINSTLRNLNFTTVKNRRKVEYINLACGFDIETTSTVIDGEKAAFMYIWMVGIGEDEPVYYGRTWEEFYKLCCDLKEKLGLNVNRRLVIYVHNLGYEFQFMRKYFKWVEVFAVAERKPIKAVIEQGIEFRDSYILSGYSLANTAKNLAKRKVEKMVGDLDYSKIRHTKTELTDKELKYCENDIKVVTAYIAEQLEIYGDIIKIPATNTGRVRSHVRNECYYTSKNHRKSSRGKYTKYRKIMEDLTLDPETYIQMKRAFMGGFTHANAHHSGKTLENVTSIDFTSSYPSVMVSEKFPMSRFKPVVINSLQVLDEYCAKYALVFDAKFTNIRAKIRQENYISESKCYGLVEPLINNGRISQAKELAITITEVDLDIIKNCYEWDKLEIANAKRAHKNYLPRAIVKSVLDLYQGKTTLKDVEGSEVEYLLSKGMLNSIYGMSVTDIVKDNSVYSDEWGIEKVDIEAEIKDYNESKSRFLYYPWGIWVTAYARRNLWTGILAIGDDYIYSDTDSLKMLNYENHKGYINWFNSQIVNKMVRMCEYYKFNKSLLSPKTKKGEVKMLGVWDYEGTYTKFKTLGAKRYLVEDNGKLTITVAGLSKQNGVNYMLEKCGGDVDKVFELFNDSLYVPADKTGKMTHTYIDEELKFKVTDYNGVENAENPLTGIHLGGCDFTLSISLKYKQFIEQLAKGYIFKGVKYK